MIITTAPEVKTVKAETYLTEIDRVILVDLSLGNIEDIHLLAVEKMAGAIISIRVIAHDSTNYASITTEGAEIIESHGNASVAYITLDALGEYTLLYSDGARWYELSRNHA